MLPEASFDETATFEQFQNPELESAFFNLTEHLRTQGVNAAAIELMTPLDFRRSGGKNGPAREHLLLAIDVEGDGYRDYIWYSPAAEPDKSSPPHTMLLKPGLGEIAETGVGYQTHKELANRNPSFNVITHATEGFGPSASPVDLLELPSYGLDRMADRAQKLLQTYCPNHQFITVGTSMGTVVVHKLLQANLRLPQDQRLDIVGNINFVPALVESGRVVRDMLIAFPAMMLLDSAAEMSVRSLMKTPRRIVDDFKTLVESRPAFKDLPLVGRFIIDLAKGVSADEVAENARHYSTHTVTGTWDPLRQIALHTDAGIEISLIKGRGHGMCLKPKEAAAKITSIALNLVQDTNQPPRPEVPMAA